MTVILVKCLISQLGLVMSDASKLVISQFAASSIIQSTPQFKILHVNLHINFCMNHVRNPKFMSEFGGQSFAVLQVLMEKLLVFLMGNP